MREEKVAKAVELREAGWTNVEIGRHLGVHKNTVSRWFHPGISRRSNAKRSQAKRRWDRETAGPCPECGGVRSSSRTRSCARCERERVKREARERTVRFIAMREEGLLNSEIAEREGVAVCVVAVCLSRAGRFGLKVPRSPHFREQSA